VVVNKEPGKVTITSELQLKQTRIPAAQYAKWRAFCERVDAAMTPRLVIAP